MRTPDGRVHLLRKSGERYREVTSQADWPSYDGDANGNRYSPITLIGKNNAARMAPKWIYSLPDGPSLETTPLVLEGVMYVTNTYECYALDAGSGQIWHYSAPVKDLAEGERGAAVSGSRVFVSPTTRT